MSGFLDQFRSKIISAVWKEPEKAQVDIDDKIALGVLLWIVAEADEKFLPGEEAKIKKILTEFAQIKGKDLILVLAAIKTAAQERIDLQRFTHVVSKDLKYNIKISIIENLFRVAYADQELDDKEVESIRKICTLLNIAHRDFIDVKIRIKKEADVIFDSFADIKRRIKLKK
ncbi:MAG: TerB family tellurite resistance protein [Candidatus Omnitrophota bacterium]